jgi:hypothetical protein
LWGDGWKGDEDTGDKAVKCAAGKDVHVCYCSTGDSRCFKFIFEDDAYDCGHILDSYNSEMIVSSAFCWCLVLLQILLLVFLASQMCTSHAQENGQEHCAVPASVISTNAMPVVVHQNGGFANPQQEVAPANAHVVVAYATAGYDQVPMTATLVESTSDCKF